MNNKKKIGPLFSIPKETAGIFFYSLNHYWKGFDIATYFQSCLPLLLCSWICFEH